MNRNEMILHEGFHYLVEKAAEEKISEEIILSICKTGNLENQLKLMEKTDYSIICQDMLKTEEIC